MDAFSSLSVNPDLPTTIAYQLKQQLAWLILGGVIEPGTRLPPVRQLAVQLSINLHTVRAAYRQLELEGLVETRQGSGTTVLPVDVQRIRQAVSRTPSHTVGVLLPSWSNPFYHSFLQGVEAVADENRTQIILCNTHDDPQRALRDFGLLAARGVDGVLAASTNMAELLEEYAMAESHRILTPLVTVDWPGARGYSVSVNLEAAGYLGTRHLLEHGHRRVGLVTFITDIDNIALINQGYFRALREAGLQPEADWIARVPGFSVEHGIEGARRLLGLPDPARAIFCVADTLALGALKVIKEAGLRVPEEVALVGFNDIPQAEMCEPGLTTVAAPAVQMGKEAMKLLKLLISGTPPERKHVLLPVHLVLRQSCGCTK